MVLNLNERGRPAPNWASPRGLYADYSRYPDIEFYAKCPKCGTVHGSYKNMRDAHARRLCMNCDREAVEKLRKLVKEVDLPKNRGKPAKSTSKLFNEADERLPAPPTPLDPRDYVLTTQRYPGWIGKALDSLIDETGIVLVPELDDEEVAEPENIEKFFASGDVFGHGQEQRARFDIRKNEQVFIDDITKKVAHEIQEEPENFKREWLRKFINIDQLRRQLQYDAANSVRGYLEDEYSDYAKKRDFLVDKGKLEHDDFFDEDENEIEITPDLEVQIDNAFDQYADEEVESKLEDPIEYLADIYGEKEAEKEAVKMVGIDYEKAAEDAVERDGWMHYARAYSNHEYELAGGAVAIRIE